jgi:hypothetical protein
MKVFSGFRPQNSVQETSAEFGLLTAAEPRTIEQVVDELNAELTMLSPEDTRWWDLSRKRRTLTSLIHTVS